MEMPDFALFPAGLVLQHATGDFRELAALPPPWERLYRKILPGPCATRISLAHTACMQSGEQSLSSDIAIGGCAPDKLWTFLLPLEAPDALAVAAGGDACHGWSSGPLRCLSLSVSAARLKRHLQLSDGSALLTQAGEGQVRLGAGCGMRLARRWQRLHRLMARTPQLLTDPAQAGRIEHAFLEAMVRYTETDTRPRVPARRARIARAAQSYLHRHSRARVGIESLCAAVGVPARTLHHAFHEVFGMAPGQYMKLHRLNEARQALLDAGAARTVSRIAMDCGFQHLGRFAVDYHLLFGETPSETAMRRRSPQAA